MSQSILKHVETITQQRDTSLLDVTITTSLVELLQPSLVRLHQIYDRRDGLTCVTSAWHDGSHSQSLADFPSKSDFVALENYPGLLRSLEQKSAYAEQCPKTQKHVLWLPVFVKGAPYACAEVVSEKPLSPHMRYVAEGIVGVYRNYLGLLDESQRDGLTGLANRRAFDRSLARLLSTIVNKGGADEERRNVSGKENWLAIIDLDFFKQINDRFGHLYGDEVLIVVADIMRRTFRVQDRIFRFGGDEFVVLLRQATFENALKTLERFRAAVEGYDFPEKVGQLTASVGFARIQPSDTPVAVLGNADDAHYFAKGHGRNRVCSYEQLLQDGKLKAKPLNGEVELL